MSVDTAFVILLAIQVAGLAWSVGFDMATRGEVARFKERSEAARAESDKEHEATMAEIAVLRARGAGLLAAMRKP